MPEFNTGRKQFLKERAEYEERQPFTKKETKQYTLQERNFIRGIQITRVIPKKDAIKVFGRSRNDKELTKQLSTDIALFYEQGVRIKQFPSMGLEVEVYRPDLSRKSYKYKGVTKGKDLTRYKSLGGTSRRYIDTTTGEEISRRERDKRLSLE